MQDVAGTIFEGAGRFIRRQYTTIAIPAIVVWWGWHLMAVFETKDVADTDVFGSTSASGPASPHVGAAC
jgi:Na+/H+-translocating membrane pyrophosphatase